MSPKFHTALAFASMMHQSQTRKGDTMIPYIAHPLSVAVRLLKKKYGEEIVIGGLLHDVVEDQGGLETLKRVKDMFGVRIAQYVEECSDSTVVGERAPWKEREVRAIESIPGLLFGSCVIMTSDKLDDASDTLAKLREVRREVRQSTRYDEKVILKKAVWDNFRGGEEGTKWYLSAIADALYEREQGELQIQLKETVDAILGEFPS